MGDATCPSATLSPGVRLLGARGADGRIKHLRTPLTVDEDFVSRAKAQGNPEARMRFAAPCEESKCSHWTGKACGLIDRVLSHLDGQTDDPRTAEDLPPCTIRASCRWWKQDGASACHACDLVVRLPDGSETAV